MGKQFRGRKEAKKNFVCFCCKEQFLFKKNYLYVGQDVGLVPLGIQGLHHLTHIVHSEAIAKEVVGSLVVNNLTSHLSRASSPVSMSDEKPAIRQRSQNSAQKNRKENKVFVSGGGAYYNKKPKTRIRTLY